MTVPRKRPARRKLIAAREEFAALLANETQEIEWQRFFSANPFVLSEGLPIRMEPDDVIPMGRPGRDEPDLILFPSPGSRFQGLGVVELKRPATTLVRVPRKRVLALSADAQTAVRQGQVYVERLERQMTVRGSSAISIGNQRHIFIIAGLSSELLRRTEDNILRRQLKDLLPASCEILPYDTLLARFETSIPPTVHILKASPSLDLIESTLAEVPPELRMPLILRDLERFSLKEIKEIMDVPLGAVKKHLSSGRAHFKSIMGRDLLGMRDVVLRTPRK